MKHLIRSVFGMALLVSPLIVNAQQWPADMAKHGEQVFATNCSF